MKNFFCKQNFALQLQREICNILQKFEQNFPFGYSKEKYENGNCMNFILLNTMLASSMALRVELFK